MQFSSKLCILPPPKSCFLENRIHLIKLYFKLSETTSLNTNSFVLYKINFMLTTSGCFDYKFAFYIYFKVAYFFVPYF